MLILFTNIVKIVVIDITKEFIVHSIEILKIDYSIALNTSIKHKKLLE